MKRAGATLVAFLAILGCAEDVSGQYFGRNKVQYDDFDFQVMETPHFDIHYYPEMSEAIEDVARMSERWYERFARTFQHEFETSKPLIFYADHPDFQQTNTLQGLIGEGTGGVTESLKNRVIMPLAGSYWDTDHVLGHELVHAFQYNIAQARRGGGLQGLYSLPLWLIEGMAEYLSVGRADPLTAMWMRDAIMRDDFPTIEQMTRESRFFPYRFGQALWAYIGGTYGDDAVVNTYRRSLRIGFPGAIQQVLGVSHDTLSAQWAETVREAYGPLMEGRQDPTEVGSLILGPETGAGKQNVSPAISPDGRYVAFLSEKDLFSVDLFLAERETGRIIRKLSNSITDPHADALRYIDSSGTFSPDGSLFAYVVFAQGDNELVIVESRNGKVQDRVAFDEIGAVNNPVWSPDGRTIAFSGMIGGLSDLFLYDLETEELTQLTDDKYADLHPAFSPDGSTLVFASDRGPETDFENLTFSKFQIVTLDLRNRAMRLLPLLGNVRHSNPQYSPDGRSIYFLSDADGFSDVYRTELATGDVYRVTGVATGVSGIVPMSPALAVAMDSGDMIFSIFSEFGFTIHSLPAGTVGTRLNRVADAGPVLPTAGRDLPPGVPARFNLVASYLDDAETGLDVPGTYRATDGVEYDPSLALDFVGQPTLGVGADAFGTYLGGGASAYFSDMLGNQILGVAVQAQGTVKDIGGQVFYADLGDRWNWAGAASHIPFQFIQQGITQDVAEDPVTGEIVPTSDPYIIQRRYRILQSSVQGQISYPFTMTRRIEAGLGFTRYGYDVEEDLFFLDPFGRVYDFERRERPDLELPALNLGQASLGLVGDYSFFGFTSPIRGGRYRFQVEGTIGSEKFMTGIFDWRRYWAPARNLTVAFRGLHYGRYGNISSNAIQPFFLGYETFIRGYAYESFRNEECTLSQLQAGIDPLSPDFSQCPAFDRLFGHRLGIVNLEARIPLIGVEQFGLVNFGFLPTELSFFFDGGLAWDDTREPTLEWSTDGFERVPVFSAGVSARVNILGILVLESYYAYPFQRPGRGWHWGFNLAPGW